MNHDIGNGKSAQIARDGSMSIYQDGNIVYLNPFEAKDFQNWIKEVNPHGGS